MSLTEKQHLERIREMTTEDGPYLAEAMELAHAVLDKAELSQDHCGELARYIQAAADMWLSERAMHLHFD